jgi:hypothetical protein
LNLSKNLGEKMNFYDLIWNVAKKEMADVGQDPEQSPQNAAYLGSVQRIQVWTFEELAKSATSDAMRAMFEELASQTQSLDMVQLYLGEKAE